MASRRTHPDAGARVPVVLPVLADSVYPISSVIPVDKTNKVSRAFISLANHLASPALALRTDDRWPAVQAAEVEATQSSTIWPSTASGTEPWSRTAEWKSRMS
jgi:hypothetical protein